MAATVTVAGLLKPEIAVSAVMTPAVIRARGIVIATPSTAHPRANSTIAAAVTASTTPTSFVIGRPRTPERERSGAARLSSGRASPRSPARVSGPRPGRATSASPR